MISRTLLQDILSKANLRDAATPRVKRAAAEPPVDDDVPIGLHGVLAATEKLLAVNRGLVPPDERDNLRYKQVHTTDKLISERVKLDADKIRLGVLRRAARSRSLKGLMPFAFDGYATGHLVGNPLSSPLEEINPISLVEQQRRLTQMGPGGLGSDQAITSEAQNVTPSQFGFICPLSGPECFSQDSQVYTTRGWIPWPAVNVDDIFACRIDGRIEWHQAERLVAVPYKGVMILGESKSIRMCVTPTHRVLNTRDRACGIERMELAEDVYGKTLGIPSRHAPYLGDLSITHFSLPDVNRTNNHQRAYAPFDIGDWAEFMGWWLAEGSLYTGTRTQKGSTYTEYRLQIAQCPRANPEKHERIRQLLIRMRLIGPDAYKDCRAFSISGKQIAHYFSQWSHGCYDKWIPEECFSYPLHARERMLTALLLGDGRTPRNRRCYCTVSRCLAESVERLAIGLGYAAYIRTEQDRRPHVKTTNYIVSLNRGVYRTLQAGVYTNPVSGVTSGNNWSRIFYDGMVYCATVPGGLLYVRGSDKHPGFWSGNSQRAGIDTRMAHGVRIGDDGNLYQRFYDKRAKKFRWVAPEEAANAVVKFPD